MTLGSACSFSLIQCCVEMLQMKAIEHQEDQEARRRLSPSPTLKTTRRNLTEISQIFRRSLFTSIASLPSNEVLNVGGEARRGLLGWY